MATPKNNFEALTLALALAITAPDEERAELAKEIAIEIAKDMKPHEVEKAKALASYATRDKN